MGSSMTAYGWIGHVLVSESDWETNPERNEIAIPDKAFKLLLTAMEDCELDSRITAHRLGVKDSDVYYLAAGVGFNDAVFGGVFHEAEARDGVGVTDKQIDQNYLDAMKEIYGVDLPPCRIMIGCAREY